MHPQAFQWVEQCVSRYELRDVGSVLEFGSRDTNGTVRSLFNADTYTGVDLHDGPSVDVIADASTYRNDPVDVVVSTELLEHAPNPDQIIRSAYANLHAGGCLIVTAAGLGRSPHGQHGAAGPAPGEHYANIDPKDLSDWLEAAGFATYQVDVAGLDVRCIAWRN